MARSLCYFTQMYQSIAPLKAIYDELGGTFVCGRKSTYRYLTSLSPIVNVAKFNKRFHLLGAGNKALDRAQCIVTGSPYQKILSPFNAMKVMVFHGTYAGLQKETIEGLVHFDHLFLTGPRMEKMFNKYCGDVEIDFSTTGFIPFKNFPEKTEENKKALLSKLDLDTSLKTVVYCPSRKKEGSWNECVKALINEVSSEYNLILRPHPSQSMNLRFQDKLEMYHIKEMAKKRKNTMIDLVDIDFPVLLMTADLLISDANSPAEEALYYDTPQLLTGMGNSSYENIKKIWVDWGMDEEDIESRLRMFDCGPVFKKENYANWHEAVCDALFRETTYSNSRSDYFVFIFGQKDKCAGRRVADIIRAKYL